MKLKTIRIIADICAIAIPLFIGLSLAARQVGWMNTIEVVVGVALFLGCLVGGIILLRNND